MGNKVKPEQNRKLRGKLAQSVQNMLRGPTVTRDDAVYIHEQVDKIVRLDIQWGYHRSSLKRVRRNREKWT